MNKPENGEILSSICLGCYDSVTKDIYCYMVSQENNMYAFRKYLHCFFVATLSYLTLGRSCSSHHSYCESLHTTALLYVEYTISLFLFTASASSLSVMMISEPWKCV